MTGGGSSDGGDSMGATDDMPDGSASEETDPMQNDKKKANSDSGPEKKTDSENTQDDPEKP
jgi:hypothetical protein